MGTEVNDPLNFFTVVKFYQFIYDQKVEFFNIKLVHLKH